MVIVSPTFPEDDPEIVMDVTGCVTSIEMDAVVAEASSEEASRTTVPLLENLTVHESSSCEVMVAEPDAILQVTALFAASLGETVAVYVSVCPTFASSSPFMEMELTKGSVSKDEGTRI